MKSPALVAVILVLALAACRREEPRHCSLIDLSWCDPNKPELPNWP